MPNGMYGGVKGRETKVGQKTFVSRPTRLAFLPFIDYLERRSSLGTFKFLYWEFSFPTLERSLCSSGLCSLLGVIDDDLLTSDDVDALRDHQLRGECHHNGW